MEKQSLDLDAIRQALAQFDQALKDYPELGEPNPERWEAFQEWLHAMEEPHDAT